MIATQTDNDVSAAVDLLSNPDTFEQMQQDIVRRADKGKQARGGVQQVDDDAVRGLQGMGFEAAAARQALADAGGDQVAALDALVAMGEEARSSTGEEALASGGAGPSGAGSSRADVLEPLLDEDDEEDDVDPVLMRELEGMVSKDPLAAYDVDVAEEGAVLAEYLGKLPTA